MELELCKETYSCYEALPPLVETREQSTETIVPDYCPDIARIVEGSGCLFVRSREIADGRVSVSGSLRMTLLYIADGSGGLKSFSYTLPVEETLDGRLREGCTEASVSGCVSALEVRALNPRKIMTRAAVELTVTPYCAAQLTACGDVTQRAENGIETLCETQEVSIIKALRSKDFVFSDDLVLSSSKEPAAELLRESASVRTTECRLIGGKIILKGVVCVEVLYLSESGTICSAAAELPFSQIVEGVEDADENTSAEAMLCLTGAELRIGGGELLAIGFSGRAVGQAKQRLLDEVASEKLANEHGVLARRAERLYRSGWRGETDGREEETMANIMDYLDWRGDLPLTVSPFNEVDGLILAELSFINFEGIVPPPELGRGVPLRDAAGTYFARHNGQEIDMGVLVPGRIPDLMCRMAHSVRFGGMLLNGYCELMDDAREQQFAALTVELGDGSIYLSYRGTDDTIVGWKEDLNMGYLEVIPSQTRALEYLGRMTRQYPDAKLRIGGHSKGGNLSVYAAVKAPAAVQDRIVRVYNNDGPGFAKPLVGTPEHTRVADRILTVVPQSSVVGQLLEHEQNVEIVRSDAEGMLQHDGFSWQVVGDHFIHLDGFSREGKVIDETLESWEGSLSPKQREAFADALYTVLTASGAKTLSDLNGDKLKSAVTMLKTYSNLDRETRQLLSGSLRALVGSYAKNVADDVQKNDLEPLRRKLERQRKKAEKRGAKKK